MSDSQETRAPAGSAYDTLSRGQLIALLKKRDAQRRLGLVWERDEIEPDKAIDRNFVVAELKADLCERPAPWANLVIEGDNYDALRWLRMTHRGQIKCIYIDPPYNTGNKDWVYNDDYVDANHRFRNSQWLEFLYQRLLIARDLLSPDGVLLCSINDENRSILELMMDQALPGMKVGSLVWRTRNGSSADQIAYLSPDHEHVLVYSNPGFSFSGVEKSYRGYSNPDNDPRGDWQAVSMKLGFTYKQRPNLFYPLHDPETDIWYPCNPDEVWRFSTQERVRPGQRLQTLPVEQFIAERRIRFPEEQRVENFDSIESLRKAIERGDVPKSGQTALLREDVGDLAFWVGKKIGYGTPRRKLFKNELKRATQPLSSWVAYGREASDEGVNRIESHASGAGSATVKDIFGQKAFEYAKPVALIRELVRQSTGPDDIVLDFFAGSATTAQAVMELNAEDQGTRKLIMVSSTEATANEPDKNICRDVTAQRIRLLNANDEKYQNLSAGFAYLRCAEIDPLTLDDELSAAAAWAILEVHHRLPLTVWQAGDSLGVHEGEETTLILVDRWGDKALEAVLPVISRSTNCFLYAFEPGQIAGLPEKANVEVLDVRATLKRLFAA